MKRVFVSYASADRDAAGLILTALRRAGFDAYRRAHGDPDCVIVLWSKAAAQSGFLRSEIQNVIRLWASDRLVLAALDDTPWPVGLSDLPVISFKGDAATKEVIERAEAIVTTQLSKQIGTIVKECISASDAVLEVLAPAPPDPAAPKPAPWSTGLSKLITAALIALAVLALISFLSPLRSPPMVAPPLESTTPSLPFVLVVLVAGIAIGAVAVWAWSIRPRWRPAGMPIRIAAPSETLSRQPMVGNDAPQVFVSYSRQDAARVEQLVQQIEKLGYAVWIDRQSTGSQRYAAPIVRAIRMSRLVALMCSQNAFASDHVIREIYVAGDHKKPFIAFQLDPTELPDEVLYFVSGFPRVSVSSIDPQRLRSEIARLVAA